MHNLWKGLVVGAVTGAAIGLTVDLLGRGRDAAIAAGGLAREHGPEVATALANAASTAAERLRDADLPDKARHIVHAIAGSDTAHALREAAHSGLASATGVAKDVAAIARDTTS